MCVPPHWPGSIDLPHACKDAPSLPRSRAARGMQPLRDATLPLLA